MPFLKKLFLKILPTIKVDVEAVNEEAIEYNIPNSNPHSIPAIADKGEQGNIINPKIICVMNKISGAAAGFVMQKSKAKILMFSDVSRDKNKITHIKRRAILKIFNIFFILYNIAYYIPWSFLYFIINFCNVYAH